MPDAVERMGCRGEGAAVDESQIDPVFAVGKVFVVIAAIEGGCDLILFDIAGADSVHGSLFGDFQRWDNNRKQQGNDGDDDKQFNQCKAVF